MGIEPTAQAWEAWVLPLYDARSEFGFYAPSMDQANRYSKKGKAPCGGALPDLKLH